MAVFLATPGAVAMSLATDIGHLVYKNWWFMVGVSIFEIWCLVIGFCWGQVT